jgi:hypothetical protein
VARPARAAENAQDFYVHGLRGGAGEDGPCGAFEAPMDLAERKEAPCGRRRRGNSLRGDSERAKEWGEEWDGRRDETEGSRGDSLKDWFHVYKSTAETLPDGAGS